MCGIVGIVDTRGSREISRELLSHMNQTQIHRGPDEAGIHIEPGVGFGHRRLSIIDLSSGQQPLFNEDGSVVVTYNGEIYNFPELMNDLIKLGHTFKTHCDTEVIVHAWEEWGEACVKHFRGMFAFGLYDRNQQKLFVARDRLGIKPFYYAQLADGIFVFGSELKSLLTYPTLPRKIDTCAVEEYFAYGYIPAPRTIYQGVFKLPPGHMISIHIGADKKSTPQPKQYWDVPFAPHAAAGKQELQQELIERLREAVKIRMVAEVPLGAFLSGGVDSSAIVAMMAGLMPEPVNTCSIAFNDSRFDESTFAAQVAKQYQTRHHVDTVDTDDYGLVDTLAALYDEPYADSSAMPTYRVCQLAKKRVTVVLSGDGGDENFAGYRRYRYAMAEQSMRSYMPSILRKPIFGALGKIYPKADWAPRMFRAKTTFESLSCDLVEGYFHGVSVMPDRVRSKLFSDQFRKKLQGYRAVEVMRAHAAKSPTDDPLSLLQYIDFKTYLPCDILTKVDRASMAHSLEVRVPLLDHKFVEWASGVPSTLKLKGGDGKHILKQSLKPHLSDDVLYRPKMGFSIPLASWLRGPLKQKIRDAVLNPVLLDTGIFNQAYLKHMVDQHQSGIKDYSAPLWTVLMFESFLRISNNRNPV